MADSTSESSDGDVSSDSDYDEYEGSSNGDYDVSSDDDSDDSNDDNNNDPRIAAKIVGGDKGRSQDNKWPGVLMLGRLLLLFILIGLVLRVLGCCLLLKH